MSDEATNPEPAAPPPPSSVPEERFSESEKGRELVRQALESLKIEVGSERANTITEAIDAEFKMKQGEILHASQEARHELAAKLGLQHPVDSPTDASAETSSEPPETLAASPTDAQIIEALKKIIEEEVVEGELKVGDLKTLTREPLMKLEEERPGALLFAFTTWGDKYAHVKVEEFEPYKNPAPGTEVEIHFRGNDQAYWKIGAGDILPPSVQCITVTDDGGNARTGVRRDAPRNGFYDENGYIRIFNNYKIKIEPPEKAQEVKPQIRLTRSRDTQTEQNRLAEQQALARTTRTVRSRPSEARSRQRRVRETQPITEAIDRDWLNAGYEASAYYAERLGVKVDPAVIFAVIYKESSGFNPYAQPKDRSGKVLSSALGLGQFMPGTWENFIESNPGLIQELSPGNPNPERTNPILSIYATTWYIANNAEQFGIREVKPNQTAEIYLMYHNGPQGYRTFKRYKELIDSGKPEEDAATESGFIVPEGYYRNKYKTTARYAQFLKEFSGGVRQVAERYHHQLPETPQATVSSAQPTIEELDRLAQNPKLEGETLLIGSSSTTGYAPKLKGTIETDAAKDRSIVTMFERLKEMPLERLRSFGRIVIQGGVKNTDHDAPTIDTSIRTMDAMVAYVRENAPNVKIYVLEVTPWNPRYDKKIREFNDHINSPDFRARVEGVIPTYAIMDNGEGRQRAAFGKPGELHVARYDRYAGVLADWITRHEAASEPLEEALDASRVAVIGDSLTDQNAGGYARYLQINGAKIPDSNHYALASRSLVDMEARLKADVEAGKFEDVQRLAILGGANDLSGAHGLDTEGIKKTLENMVDLLLSQRPPIKPILVTLPPVLGYKGWGGNAAERQKQVEKVNDWIRQYAAGHTEVSYYDLYAEVNDPDRPGYAKSEFYGDGLHLSQAGSRLAAQGIERVLLS